MAEENKAPEEEFETIKLLSEKDLYLKWKTWSVDERYEALTKQKLTVQFLKDHMDEINWYAVSVNMNLTCDILDEFSKKIKWAALCMSPNAVSDVILYNYYMYMDWPIIMSKQFLDMKLLVALSEKYRKSRSKKAKIFWNSVCKYQKLDADYVDAYKRFMNFKYISMNGNIEDEVFDKYIKYFDIPVFLKAKKIEPSILEKHSAYIQSALAEEENTNG